MKELFKLKFVLALTLAIIVLGCKKDEKKNDPTPSGINPELLYGGSGSAQKEWRNVQTTYSGAADESLVMTLKKEKNVVTYKSNTFNNTGWWTFHAADKDTFMKGSGEDVRDVKNYLRLIRPAQPRNFIFVRWEIRKLTNDSLVGYDYTQNDYFVFVPNKK